MCRAAPLPAVHGRKASPERGAQLFIDPIEIFPLSPDSRGRASRLPPVRRSLRRALEQEINALADKIRLAHARPRRKQLQSRLLVLAQEYLDLLHGPPI